MNQIENRLKELLYECDQHKKRIVFVRKKLKSIMPLNEDIYSNLSEEYISFINQLIFRFSKSQDTMGEKLFIVLLLNLSEDFRNKPFIDILNRLEKLEFLSKNEWMELRKNRNEIAHEYSFNIDEVVDSINLIYEVSDILLNIYQRFFNYCENRFDFIKRGIEI